MPKRKYSQSNSNKTITAGSSTSAVIVVNPLSSGLKINSVVFKYDSNVSDLFKVEFSLMFGKSKDPIGIADKGVLGIEGTSFSSGYERKLELTEVVLSGNDSIVLQIENCPINIASGSIQMRLESETV